MKLCACLCVCVWGSVSGEWVTGYCVSFSLFHRKDSVCFPVFTVSTGMCSSWSKPPDHSASGPRSITSSPRLVLGSLKTLLLVTVFKYLFVGWRWMVAVGRRWWIGTHHHMGGARLWRVCWVCHGNPGVASCHCIHPKALHTPWLLGNWKEWKTVQMRSNHQAATSLR